MESATAAMTSSLRTVALEPWVLPAEQTLGGSTGGLVSTDFSISMVNLAKDLFSLLFGFMDGNLL